jgi:DNA-binding transcriptional ArsR family regulator
LSSRTKKGVEMAGDADLSQVGALLSDSTRATILLTLLNGGMTSASALAARADVSRPLASAHLRKLTEGGLITVEPHGRHRFYRLSSQRVADALESLILLSPASAVTSLRGSKESIGLQRGRLCYDHLAGRLGVALTRQMAESGLLDKNGGDYEVTSAGASAFEGLGIDLATLRAQERPLSRACLDWSEKDHHLAGSLGAALTNELFRLGWVEGREASRVVMVTEVGRQGLWQAFGLESESLELTAAAA